MLGPKLRGVHTKMDLKTYTNQLPRGGVAALAERLGTSTVYLSQLSARQNGREPSPELCVQIESATDCAVMRWDLRPSDWHLIWPELMTRPGRPDIPAMRSVKVAA